MAYVQSNINSNGTGSSVAVLVGTVTVSNTIVVGVSWDHSGAENLSDFQDNLGNVYTKLGTTGVTASNQNGTFYWAPVTVGGACTVTATFLASRDSTGIVASEYSGRHTTAPIGAIFSITEAGDFNSGVDGTVTSASIVPLVNGCDIVAIMLSGAATTTITPGTDYIEREDDATGPQIQLEDFPQTTAASINGRWNTVADLGGFNAIVLALAPGAAPGQILRPDADTTTTGWTTAPLFSKVNEAVADGTIITATAS